MCETITNPDGTTVIVCRGHAKRPGRDKGCARCRQPTKFLCDATEDPVRPFDDEDPKQSRCSVRMCAAHVWHGTAGKHFCFLHRHLATNPQGAIAVASSPALPDSGPKQKTTRQKAK